jgi:hypothetical protein
MVTWWVTEIRRSIWVLIAQLLIFSLGVTSNVRVGRPIDAIDVPDFIIGRRWADGFGDGILWLVL